MNEATSQGANKLPPYNVHWTTLNFYQQLLAWHEENLDDAHVTSELDKDALKIRFTSTHLYTAGTEQERGTGHNESFAESETGTSARLRQPANRNTVLAIHCIWLT